MGKKKDYRLGTALKKDRNRERQGKLSRAGSWLHSCELDDGYDWGRLNLKSVTEESHLDEFLRTAELAGTEFTAEKLNITVIDRNAPKRGLTALEKEAILQAQKENTHLLRIPRRPPWNESTTAEELDQKERDSFLQWRRVLAGLQEDQRLTLTPFEKNLELWRQLWRVVERSDIVVQIVDARNPLLFHCEDLERYVKEVNPQKVNLLLVNKADMLTTEQRSKWADYFKSRDITAVFWSALEESDLKEHSTDDSGSDEESEPMVEEPVYEAHLKHPHFQEVYDIDGVSGEGDSGDGEGDGGDGKSDGGDGKSDGGNDGGEGDGDSCCDGGGNDDGDGCEGDGGIGEGEDVVVTKGEGDVATTAANPSPNEPQQGVESPSHTPANPPPIAAQAGSEAGCDNSSGRLLTKEELLQLFSDISQVKDGVTVVGMVGYPNVGKSSTINALYQDKKVSVSATPGKTKHFQTLPLSDQLMLCDCPGLVFPSFATSTAEMVCNGVLPIDQMRDHIAPISLVTEYVPRRVLEETYGVMLPRPGEGEDPSRPPTAEELLNAYGYVRGYMTSHGMPDGPRSARYILKDYVKGRLLFCHPPPGVDSGEFNSSLGGSSSSGSLDEKMGSTQAAVLQPSQFDRKFFVEEQVRVVSKGVHGKVGFARKSGFTSHHASATVSEEKESAGTLDNVSVQSHGKPWKKHFNKNKKEKTRRVKCVLND
ncbi:hypothetical protein EMCRGX_G016186 [Ephydatia muelleri]